MISIENGKELGLASKLDMDYEYYPHKPLIEPTVGKNKVELPDPWYSPVLIKTQLR